MVPIHKLVGHPFYYMLLSSIKNEYTTSSSTVDLYPECNCSGSSLTIFIHCWLHCNATNINLEYNLREGMAPM